MTRYFDDFKNLIELKSMSKQEIDELASTWLEELSAMEEDLRDLTLKFSLSIQTKKQDLRELNLIRRNSLKIMQLRTKISQEKAQFEREELLLQEQWLINDSQYMLDAQNEIFIDKGWC